MLLKVVSVTVQVQEMKPFLTSISVERKVPDVSIPAKPVISYRY
jgi:hypothetical protein